MYECTRLHYICREYHGYSHVRRENIMFTTCYTTVNCSPCEVSRTGAGNNEALVKNIYNMIQMNHDS